MNRLFDNLLKVAGVGVVLYGVYKLGEMKALSSVEDDGTPETKTEGDFIRETIQNLKSKVGKTLKEKNTLELLEIKLKQLNKK